MRAAIVTGADHGYFPLMHALLRSLAVRPSAPASDLLVLDFGLKPEDVAVTELLGASVRRPTWWFDAPERLRTLRNLSYAARPMIPAFFPGYDVYVWLDADISVQHGGFVADFLKAAEGGALAVAEERDPAYIVEPYALKWHIGNAFRCFGVRDGLRFCLGKPINSGAFALLADAPHWTAWQGRYRQAVAAAKRANLDQHALGATLALDGLPAAYLDSTYNWICARSQPFWDEDRQVFCRPRPPFEPVRVLHLAGRQKKGLREIRTLAGGMRSMPLAYAGRPDDALDVEAVGA